MVSHIYTHAHAHTHMLIDVELVNKTPIVHQEENHKVILQCSITGLSSEETDFEIAFIHLSKCEHHQQQPSGQTEIKDAHTVSINNGTTRELQIPRAKVAHSGDYHCRYKIHTLKSRECMYVETQPKIIDIRI